MEVLRTTGTAARRRVRDSLLAAIRTPPVLHTINWLTRRRPRVLLYHRFGPASTWRALGADVFEAHLRLIRDRFVPMTLSDLAEAQRAGTAPANAVAITIDDGYEDAHRYALPLLRAYRVPATFYVTTGFVEGATWLWPDAIAYLVEHTSRPSVAVGVREAMLSLDSPASRHRAWHTLTEQVERLSWASVPAFLGELAERLGVVLPASPTPEYRAASWSQLAEFAEAGVEIGDHTWSHPVLTRCTSEELSREIRDSKALLEARLGGAVRSFAYPHGIFDATVCQAVRDAGFSSAVTDGLERAPDWGDGFTIPRRGNGGSLPRFHTAIFGVYDLAAQLGIRASPAADAAAGEQ